MPGNQDGRLLGAGTTTDGRSRDHRVVDAGRRHAWCAGHHRGAVRDVAMQTPARLQLAIVQVPAIVPGLRSARRAAHLAMTKLVRLDGQFRTAAARRQRDASIHPRVRLQARWRELPVLP